MWCSSIYNKTISGIRGIRQRRNITLVSNIMNGCYAASSIVVALYASHIFFPSNKSFSTQIFALEKFMQKISVVLTDKKRIRDFRKINVKHFIFFFLKADFIKMCLKPKLNMCLFTVLPFCVFFWILTYV